MLVKTCLRKYDNSYQSMENKGIGNTAIWEQIGNAI